MILDYIPVDYKKRVGASMMPTTLTIHSTGNATSTAKNERSWLTNTANTSSTSYHIVVDEDDAICSIPLNEVAHHAGNSTGNATSIGLEICESGDRAKTLANASKVVASILKDNNWSTSKLRKHRDWLPDTSICPQILPDGNMWDGFVKMVEEEMNMTEKDARTIVQEKTGFSDDTMKYLSWYKYGEELIEKLAKAMS